MAYLLLCLIASTGPFCYYVFLCFGVGSEGEGDAGEGSSLRSSELTFLSQWLMYSQNLYRQSTAPCFCSHLRLQPDGRVDHIDPSVVEEVAASGRSQRHRSQVAVEPFEGLRLHNLDWYRWVVGNENPADLAAALGIEDDRRR